jgi:crotonobetainyl-CoA:carnitine CoA-transferase CaiB-like acyl-CoA transferase
MTTTPLAGIRVLEIGGYISMPYAASLLAALGADVVKVERPGPGDDFRRGMADRSPYFRQYNSGKRSLAVDLKSSDGVAVVEALIPRFDVLMENMRPGKMDSLGLGPERCRALRPDLVYASVTGFGSGGPMAERPAYDTIGQAYGGLYSVLSDAGHAQLSGTPLADLITGISAFSGILAALVGRGATGQGQTVETSLMESVSTLTIDALSQYFDNGYVEPTRQSRHPQAQNFVLQTAAGDPIAIHLSSSEKFWRAFTAATGRSDLLDDPRFTSYASRNEHYDALRSIVEDEFRTRDTAEWERRLTEHDVPYAPVLSMSGYLNDPQVAWLDLIQPEQDGVALLRPPWKLDGARPPRDPHVPLVGEDTYAVASEVLDDAEIDRLVAAGVLYAPTT